MHRYEFHKKLGTSHFDCFGSKCQEEKREEGRTRLIIWVFVSFSRHTISIFRLLAQYVFVPVTDACANFFSHVTKLALRVRYCFCYVHALPRVRQFIPI